MYEKYKGKQLCDNVNQLWVVLDLLIPAVKKNELLGKHFYTKNNKVGIFVTLKVKLMFKLQKWIFMSNMNVFTKKWF